MITTAVADARAAVLSLADEIREGGRIQLTGQQQFEFSPLCSSCEFRSEVAA